MIISSLMNKFLPYFLLFIFLLNLCCSENVIPDSVKVPPENKEVQHLLKKHQADPALVRTRHPVLYVDILNGFLPTIYVIVISELGDKTFFIAAIMSIRNSRWIVYLGAMSALTTMTILSALLGFATTVVPRWLTWFSSASLFAIFGIKMLKDAYEMTPENAEEEYNEVKEDLKRRDSTYAEDKCADDVESCPDTVAVLNDSLPIPIPTQSTSKFQALKRLFYALFTKVFVEAFVLTFLAEWGDRSQISTIILGATKNVLGVIAGGVLGHAICTGLAVVGGRLISQKIPVKWLTFAGGVTFLLFSLHTFYIGPDAMS